MLATNNRMLTADNIQKEQKNEQLAKHTGRIGIPSSNF